MTALIRKRSELAGQIQHTQDQLRQLYIDLGNVDATLKLFDPEIDIERIKARSVRDPNRAQKGEVARIVMETLRNASRPLSSTEIAERVVAERGLDTENKQLLKQIAKRTGSCLRGLRQRGVLRSEQGPGQCMLWEVAS